MKIQAKLEASETSSHCSFTIDELNYSELEWSHLSEEEKLEAIKGAINELTEQPYWCLTSYSQK